MASQEGDSKEERTSSLDNSLTVFISFHEEMAVSFSMVGLAVSLFSTGSFPLLHWCGWDNTLLLIQVLTVS